MGNVGHFARRSGDGEVATGLDGHFALISPCTLSLWHHRSHVVASLEPLHHSLSFRLGTREPKLVHQGHLTTLAPSGFNKEGLHFLDLKHLWRAGANACSI